MFATSAPQSRLIVGAFWVPEPQELSTIKAVAALARPGTGAVAGYTMATFMSGMAGDLRAFDLDEAVLYGYRLRTREALS